MKKIKNIFSLLVVALAGLLLTACSKDDLGTNQYQGGVSLNVYGPSPVMRGGQLRFLGSNLDQIREVIIPDGISITNIEVVKAGVPSEIRVTIPKDGPVPGKVILVSKTDERITTKTDLNYIEGIEITAFPTSAMPGDVIKIEGDYLNLIYSLAFADNVLVSADDFVSHDRYAIEVKVPEEAKTGKLELYTADLTVVDKNSVEYQIIKTDEAIEIGVPTTEEVKSPRGTAAAEGEITAKAGEKITLTGTYYNVVSAIAFGDVEVSEIEVSEDGTTLSFVVPATAPDGVFNLVCKSGEEVPVATLTTIKPTNCTATPNPVKALKALTISGQDMDVVTGVKFEGADVVTGDNLNVSADKVVVALVPETATEGKLQLIMANGATVDVEFTLVKPTVTAYNANPVSAGAAIQITGTDLDLVKTINFGDGTATINKEAVSADGTTITVIVPMEGTSGKPVFNLANGTSIEGPDLTINEAVFCYITEMPVFDDDTTPDAGDIFAVPVANGDKLTNVLVNGTEVNFVLSEKNGTLTFGIPADATSTSVVKLISSNGEIEYKISVKPATTKTKVILTGPVSVGNWSNNITIPVDAFKDLPEGKVTMVMYYAVEADGAKIKFNDGHWKNIKLEGCVGDSEYFFEFDPNETKAYVPLSAEDIAHLTDPSILDWGGSMFINGLNVTFNKIVLEIEIPQEKDLVTEFGLTNMDGTAITFPYQFTWNNDGRFLIAGDKLKSAGLKQGSVLSFYKSTSAKGQVQINYNTDGWPNVTTVADWDPKLEVLTYEFTSETAAQAITYGLAIQGDLGGITKMTILP